MHVCYLFLINTQIQTNHYLCSEGGRRERDPKTQLGTSVFPNCQSIATLSGSEKARAAEELRLKGYVLQLLSSP